MLLLRATYSPDGLSAPTADWFPFEIWLDLCLSHCGTWHGIWKIPIRWKWSPISNLRFHAFQRDYRVSRLRMIRIRLPSSMTLASLWLLQTTSSILLSSIWMSMCIFFAPHSHPETILLDPLARSRYPILKKISRHSSIFVFKKGSASDQKKGHLVDVTREPPEGWYEWETVAMESDVCFFESSREHLPTFFLPLNLLHSTENAVKGAQEGEGIWLLEQASELTQLTQKGTKKIIRILLRGDNPEHEDKYMILLKRPLDYKMANLFGDKTWMFSCEVEERRWWIVGRSNFQISCCLVMVRVRANRPFGVLRVFARLLPFLLVLWECRSGTWPLRAVINSISGIHRI